MSRRYLVFGSDDKLNWELLNTVEASGAEQALGKAREQESHRHYGCTPERNWTAMTPQVVERPPLVRWQPLSEAQMTVDEVLSSPVVEDEDDDIVERAESVLAKAKEEAGE